jgi:hypothetical protein
MNEALSNLSFSCCKGPDKVFSGIHLAGRLGDETRTYNVAKDSFDLGDGEDEPGAEGKGWYVTPEPGCTVLLGTDRVVLDGMMRPKLAS